MVDGVVAAVGSDAVRAYAEAHPADERRRTVRRPLARRRSAGSAGVPAFVGLPHPWCNSEALRRASITSDTPEPVLGSIARRDEPSTWSPR